MMEEDECHPLQAIVCSQTDENQVYPEFEHEYKCDKRFSFDNSSIPPSVRVKLFSSTPAKSCPSNSSFSTTSAVTQAGHSFSNQFPAPEDSRHSTPNFLPGQCCVTYSACEMSNNSFYGTDHQHQSPSGTSHRVKLNVGGMLYETTLDTLLKDQQSFFAAMWKHRNNDDLFWLDRDGSRFADVLNFLRNGTVWLNDVPSLMALREEAIYFQLSQLQELCEEKISDMKTKAEKEKSELLNAIKASLVSVLSNSTNHPFGRVNSSKESENVFCIDEDF